jgi:hypothetical protein
MMPSVKLADFFKVVITRPLNSLDKVSIAELAQFTEFDPKEGITMFASADLTLRREWPFEIKDTDLNNFDFNSLYLCFKDGSHLILRY